MRSYHLKMCLMLLALGASCAPVANACKCVTGDAKHYAKDMATIFLADVNSIVPAEAQLVLWDDERVRGVPITLGNVEVIKGAIPSAAKFFEVGFESACQPHLTVGSRRTFVLWKNDQRGISLCNVPDLTDETILEIRRAVRLQK